MKIARSAPLLALLFIATAARAITLPATEDASSSAGKISAAGGKATSLAVGPTKTAFIQFDLDSLPAAVNPALVTGARLRLYVAKVKAPGTAVKVESVTQEWHEDPAFAKPEPTRDPIAVANLVVDKSKRFIYVDVTDDVIAWLLAPLTNHGFALSSLGSLAFGSKEGSGTGYPAELEIDVDLAAQPDRAVFFHETAAANPAAATASGWQVRTLTDGVAVPDPGGSIARVMNTITLQPGIYAIEASASAYAVGANQLVVRNVTTNAMGSPSDEEAVIKGLTSFSNTAPNAHASTGSTLSGILTVASTPMDVELWHYVASAQATSGFGFATGQGGGPATTVKNRHCQISITRIK